LWLHSLKVAQLLRSAACLHTYQSRSYLNHLVQDYLLDSAEEEKLQYTENDEQCHHMNKMCTNPGCLGAQTKWRTVAPTIISIVNTEKKNQFMCTKQEA